VRLVVQFRGLWGVLEVSFDSCAKDGGEKALVFGIETRGPTQPVSRVSANCATSSSPSDAHSARSCLSDLFTVANSLLCYPFHDVFSLLSLPFS